MLLVSDVFETSVTTNSNFRTRLSDFGVPADERQQFPLIEAFAENKVPEDLPTNLPVVDVRTDNALRMSFESFCDFCFFATCFAVLAEAARKRLDDI